MGQMLEQGMLPFTAEDLLGATGERIVADRYLLKDVTKESLAVGSLVVAVLDKKRAYHELARVVELHDGEHTVTVELKDGVRETLPIQQVDVLAEMAPREMWRRVAKGAASVTKDPAYWEERFYHLQSGWKYVPGGRINASMGSGMQTTSYNCFVIPNVGPSLRDYAESFGQTLEIQARSGGVGMNLSRIPPQGSLVPVSEGPRAPWLNLVLDVWHADLLEFLDTPYPNSTKVVKVTKDFLRAVEEDADWQYVFPDTGTENYDDLWTGDLTEWMKAGRPVTRTDGVSARELYDRIIASGVMVLSDLVGTVLYPGDQRSTIASTLADMWERMAEGKRVSVVLSSLRPRYSYVHGVNGRSSGAYSWGQLYDKGNQVFGQGFGPVGVGEIMSVGCQLTLQGGSRRGALMLILNDRHADVRKFIRSKQVDGVITGANISLGVSEEFMAAKSRKGQWELGFVHPESLEDFDGDFETFIQSGGMFEITESIDAETLWDELITSAWKSAEPGVVFLGRANEMSNSYYFNPLVATNPCGEQPLPAYGICNLGAVVLSKFALGFADDAGQADFQDKAKEEAILNWLKKSFDAERAHFLLHHVKWEELEETTRLGIRFQDAVIDATYYPFEQNRRNQMKERRVGLGIMGLHDLLLKCGMRYGSPESVGFIDVVMGLMAEWSYLESVELAKENGPFPAFEADKFLQSGYMKQMTSERPHVAEAIRKYGVRNVTTMTIAPTGTTGTMVGCSTGCEPYYAWSYFRNSRLGMFEENAAVVQEYYDAHDGADALPDYFVTSMDLTPEEHVRVQGALQKWIDSSISKTCNAPNSYTIENTKNLYNLAHELGCKGITIYRDGSRSEQVLSLKAEDTGESGKGEGRPEATSRGTGSADADNTVVLDGVASETVGRSVSEVKQIQTVVAAMSTATEGDNAGAPYVKRRRPDVLYGATYKKNTPLGKAYITINDDPEEHVALEVFVNLGKAGSDVTAANEALGRAITLYLRDSNNPNKEAELVKHFAGIGGSSSVGFGDRRITSVPDAIAKALIEHSETFPMRQAAFQEWASGQEMSEREQQATGDAGFSGTDTHVGNGGHGVDGNHAHGPIGGLRSYSVERDLCPNCHQHAFIRTGGCYECEACGYSKC